MNPHPRIGLSLLALAFVGSASLAQTPPQAEASSAAAHSPPARPTAPGVHGAHGAHGAHGGHGGHGGHGAHDPSLQHDRRTPYAGLQQRDIKALSEQQVADLRAGRGMAMALPAELNGYPGPMHALELAEPLRLDADARARTQALFERMQQEARSLGEEVITAERELDRLFRDRRVTPDRLAAATAKAAAAQGRLRASHLRHHLAMMEVLTPEQVERYNRLRGY